MQVFINRILLDHRGEKIKEGKEADAPFARLGVFLVEALLRDLPGDAGAGNGLKMRRWTLAKKIQKVLDSGSDESVPFVMDTTDVAMVKKRMESFMPTMIMGPAFAAIEGEEAESVEAQADVRQIK